jgi:hypothetical protein
MEIESIGRGLHRDSVDWKLVVARHRWLAVYSGSMSLLKDTKT